MALTKSEIKKKINYCDPSIQLIEKNNTKNLIWQNFRIVYMDHMKLNWACCTICNDIVAYSATIGTNGLHRHPCVKLANPNMPVTTKQQKKIKDDDFLKDEDVLSVEDEEIKPSSTLSMKTQIRNKIIAGDPSVQLKKPKNATALWRHFGVVFMNNKKLPWVCCVKCKELLAYSLQSGTSGLRRHRCVKQPKFIKPNINPLEHALNEEMSVDVFEDSSHHDILFVEEYTPSSLQNNLNSAKTWTRQEVKERILANDHRFELKTPKKTRSLVWENFRVVFIDKKRVEWAICIKCKKVLTYTGIDGTSGLNQHKCVKLFKLDNPDEDSQIFKTIPGSVLHDFCRKQLSFVTKDLLPLNVLEGTGFRELAQALINIGAQYGKQNVDDVLKSRKTIKRLVMPVEYEQTKASMKMTLCEQHLAFAIDLWRDEHIQQNYLTLTSHHITKEFKLAVHVLANRELTQEQQVGSGILQLVTGILKEFELEQCLDSGIFITNNSEHVKAALQNQERLLCACQNLNLIMNDVIEKEHIPELNLLIEASKVLVVYFDNAELNSKLSKSLEQHVKNSWNSIYNMLHSILEQYQEIKKILLKKNDIKKFTNIDYNFLKQLVEFLKPFKECSERLSIENEPVIQEYVLWHQKLLNLCAIDTLDSEVIRSVKTITEKSLINHFEPSNIHYVALFLNPPFKDLKCLTAAKREEIVASVKHCLTQIYKKNTKTIEDRDRIPSSSNSFVANQLSATCDNALCESEVNKQISIYMNTKIQIIEPLLSFWEKSGELHLLQELSRQVLCVPPSSTTSERVFSVANQILAERRTHFLGEHLNEVIFLHKNMKYNVNKI